MYVDAIPAETPLTMFPGFKIYEDGFDAKGEWAVTRLYNNKGKMTFTLPSCIQNGQ
jgi:cellulase